jgi:glutathione S-transferase
MARDSAGGAYFLGEDFSIVDIAFFPWMQRSLSVLTVRQPLWAQTDEPLWRIQLW